MINQKIGILLLNYEFLGGKIRLYFGFFSIREINEL